MRWRLIVTILAAVCAFGGASAAAAPPPPGPTPATGPAPATGDPLAAQLQKAADEKARVDAIKSSLGAGVAAAKQQQQTLADLVSANQSAIAATLAKLCGAEQEVNDAQAREASEHASAAAARARELQDRRLLAQAVRMQYLEQDSLIGYMLSSQSMSDLLGRTAAISQVAQRSEQLLSSLREDVAAATGAEDAAHSAAEAAAAATVVLSQQQQELAAQTAHANDLIAQLGTQARAAASEIARSDAEDAALAQRIADLRIQELDRTIAAAEEADWNAANFYLANHLGTLPASRPAALPVGTRLLWPVPGAIVTQGFGPSPYPFEPGYAGFPHFHTGLDLAAPLDTPVLAAADGVVVSATESGSGYGNHVVVGNSATMLTLYGHLATMLVSAGDTVHRGQPIGLLGSTGNSTGPHLHLEVRINNVPTDPASLLSPPS